jgi:hypothetical protein
MSDTDSKYQDLMKRREEREAARAEKVKALKIERLELEERFEKELGPMGEQFAIVDATHCGEGFVVIRLGESVLHKQFMASKLEEPDYHEFVFPAVVHPAKDAFVQIAARRPGLRAECAAALLGLYGVKLKGDAGK